MRKQLTMSQEIKDIIDEYANERLWYINFIREYKLIGEFNKYLARLSAEMNDANKQMRDK
jgi:hypothetical protein